MMGSNEIRILHRINQDFQKLIEDFNVVVADITTLTEVVYDKEIEKCDNEIDIKLLSHM